MSERAYSLVCPPGLHAFGGPNGHANYDENQGKARHAGRPVGPEDCCVLCGKKALGGGIFVLLCSVGEYITEAELAEDDLGCYPVGSDCAKKLKAAGLPVIVRAPGGGRNGG